jgi:hypothetical protein
LHVPESHVDPMPAHTTPHAPQLAASRLKSAQVPLHSVCPVAHVQTLFSQTWVEAQRFPHEPQLFESPQTSTQTPPQVEAPGPQAHVPD